MDKINVQNPEMNYWMATVFLKKVSLLWHGGNVENKK